MTPSVTPVRIASDLAVSPEAFVRSGWACAFPVSCRLASGRILCAYRRGREKHSRDGILMVQGSPDDGRTWSEPATIYDGVAAAEPESVHAGAIGQASDGVVVALFTAVPVAEAQSYIFSPAGRRLAHRFYVSHSQDEGASWTPPEYPALPGTPPLTYINSRPLALPDGSLLVAVEVTTETSQQAVMIGRYLTGQRRFTPFHYVANDTGGRLSFGDPKLLALPDGRILLWLWTFAQATEETLPAHLCESADGGETWSAPRPTPLACQNSAILRAADGRLLVAGNVRVPPAGIRLWALTAADGGWTAGPATRMWDERAGRVLGVPLSADDPTAGDPSQGRLWDSLPRFTFGAPDLVSAGDSTSLLTYYAESAGFAQVRACRFLSE